MAEPQSTSQESDIGTETEPTTPRVKGPARAAPRQFHDDDEYTSEEFEQMMAMSEGTLANIEEGEIVKARVLRVTDNAVILDVGFKS